ncbi:MAG: metallophosphoesterase family protein [Pseudomonadota bacterium]
MLLYSKKLGRQPTGKPDQRVYAVGDIHGCLTETKELLQKIKTDDDYRSPAETFLVFLGDLVDRGPDSRGVIEFLKSPPFDFAKPLFVMGNHEEMMVRGLMGEAELLPDWLEYGGYACAESYGVPRSQLIGQEPAAMQHILRSAIPKSHVIFLSSFLESVQFGDFLFTHAGIQPGVPIEQQNARELRWIRKPFLDFKGDHGVIVVHGHTITDEVELRSNRIGLDTGAYKTGVLSAVCVDETEIAFLSTE